MELVTGVRIHSRLRYVVVGVVSVLVQAVYSCALCFPKPQRVVSTSVFPPHTEHSKLTSSGCDQRSGSKSHSLKALFSTRHHQEREGGFPIVCRTRDLPSPDALFQTVCDAPYGLLGMIKRIFQVLMGVRGREIHLVWSRFDGGALVALVVGLVSLMEKELALKGTMKHRPSVLLGLKEDDDADQVEE